MLFIQVLWLLFPAGFANMAPLLAKKLFPRWNTPVDLNKLWNGYEIFGSHKTYRGLLCGGLTGFFIFYLQQRLYISNPTCKSWSLFNYETTTVFFGFWMGLCALLGDLIKSFCKRRAHIAPGQPWIPFDQIDWIIGALLSVTLIFLPKFEIIVSSLTLGIVLHLIIRRIAFALGLVSDPL